MPLIRFTIYLQAILLTKHQLNSGMHIDHANTRTMFWNFIVIFQDIFQNFFSHSHSIIFYNNVNIVFFSFLPGL